MAELSQILGEPQHMHRNIFHYRLETSLGNVTIVSYNHLDNLAIEIEILDTNNVGSEKYIMGSIVLYDTKCRNSFESAKSRCISLLNDKKKLVILVGNANTSISVVPALEAEQFASEQAIEFLEFDVKKEVCMAQQCFQKLIADIHNTSIEINLIIGTAQKGIKTKSRRDKRYTRVIGEISADSNRTIKSNSSK
ncbi:hypothetical protein MFLAVUS_006549 [Mucor flavus]|uniref:Uncharacterized protein n=1 Tax=Mucor flavus TaxID=439312 RepID=A0ABP9Z1W1_9FUNG